MELVNQLAQTYAERYSSRLDPLLEEIAAYTAVNHPEAHMLSGPLQGKLLEMISRMLCPRRVLEVGTFMGYSALCLAAGLSGDGRLHTIELRDADADRAAGYFRRSEGGDRIILHRGNALAIIPTLQEDWDLVFIDADKPGYIDYYEMILPRVKSGGMIIADNVLFHGQVLEESVTGKSAIAIQAFNDRVAADDRVEKVMLTVRDGLFLIRKK
ncbi:MAG TPA: O-methyltransferase [Puia sp.]|uniref:O-methyltransferase n=1 Tax=Puia sp. TaxID=2045100 RepID=UPI002BD050B9|nr:O-methyltransferase [Puia sp.]HVU95065.1 O-methyltransferase [Puia sp.]